MAGVLDGIRVLDLARYIAGPICGVILGEFGAEVIRIENPTGGEDREQGPAAPNGDNFRYTMCNRNKKGVALDLTKPKGQAIFRKLVEKSDVIVEAFSPPVKAKLGVTYEELRAIKPDIIFVSISGFGSYGPETDRLCFDQVAQAESGAMAMTGFPDGMPTRSQVPWVDEMTGLHGVIGVMAALAHRKETGEGQSIELALIDTAVSMTGFMGTAAEFQVLNSSRPRVGNCSYHAYADTFVASDGGQVLITMVSSPIWRRLARIIGRPEYADDPRFIDDTTRFGNRQLITDMVQQWVGQRPRQEVMDVMREARVPCGRVNKVEDTIWDPHVQARGLFQMMDVPKIGPVVHPRLAITMSRTPASMKSPAPAVGEHNREVLCDLIGLSEQELTELKSEGVI